MSKIDDLTVFQAVVVANSFVEAAKRLGMTSSGVSRKISRFEDRLGVRLFNRTTRTLSLTEAGDALAERCEAILNSIDAAEHEVREFSASPRGALRIAASDALSSEVIVPFIKGFSARYPNLSTTLIQGDGGVDLLNERVDLALMFERPDETSFIVKKIIADPWIICASPDYLDQNGRPKSPEELRGHRCLTIHARGLTRDNWHFQTGNAHQTVKVRSCFSGIGLTVKAAALEGIGIARLAHFLVCPDINKGLLEPILLEYMPPSDRHIYAVYPNRQHLPSKVRTFLDEFVDYVRGALPVPDILSPQ